MNLKREDLIQPCLSCDGTGKLPEKPIAPKNMEFREEILSLEFGTDDCRQCRGVGEILTGDGLLITNVFEIAKKQNKI